MGNIKYWQQFARAKTSVPRYHSGPIQQQQANPSTSASGHFDNNLSANFVGAVFPLRHAPLSSTLNFNIFREAKILFRLTVGRSLLHFQPTVWGIVKSITSDGHLLNRLTGLGNIPVHILRYNLISLIHRMAGLVRQQLSSAGRLSAGRLDFERQQNGPAHLLYRLL